MRLIDLNADLGEGFGAWPMGADEELLDIVTSANIACGFHAGDPDTMVRTMELAVARGVALGAHPGLPDLQGFGRRQMAITLTEAQNLVAYQVGAAQGIARMVGGHLAHVKLHGALANMAAQDDDLAHACFTGALRVVSDLILVVIAGTAHQRAAEGLGAHFAIEVFADRTYDETGFLMDRRLPGAVLHDPDQIANRVVAMVEAGAIQTVKGEWLPTRINTICLHGDTAGAGEIARRVKTALKGAGMVLRKLDRVDCR
jgi:UPF0271 protein